MGQLSLFDNPCMYYSVCEELGQTPNIGTLREIFFITSLVNAKKNIFYSTSQADFNVDNMIFEIGGKSKSGKQLIDLDKPAYLVKDEILLASRNTIPLYLFGFLY